MVKIGGSWELNGVLETFRQEVINDVIQYRIDHGTYWSKSADEKDYPKMVAACEYKKERAAGRSLKGRCYTPRSQYLHPLVLAPIVSLAPLGTTIPSSTKNSNYGTCAEDDAATKVLNQMEAKHTPLPSVKEFVFAQPIRPRTMEPEPCCPVCEFVFG